MYDFIKGNLEAINPAQAVVYTSGFGYRILITFNTFQPLRKFGSESSYICIIFCERR